MRRAHRSSAVVPATVLALAVLVLVLLPGVAIACPACDPAMAARQAIRSDPDRWFYLVTMPLPFLLVGLVVVRLHRIGRAAMPGARSSSRRSVRSQ
jgi:hypothetical protein